MTRTATPKLGAYAALTGIGLVAALVLGRPELGRARRAVRGRAALRAVARADAQGRCLSSTSWAPSARSRARRSRPSSSSARTATRATSRCCSTSRTGSSRSRRTRSFSGSRPTSGGRSSSRSTAATGARTCSATSSCARRMRSGSLVHETAIERRQPLKVYPRAEELRRLLRPVETRAFAGNQVSRARGEGIEFADLRPFVPGDRIRRINWRATARRGEPWVNETHPERNSDVVLFLDTFVEARAEDEGTLDHAVGAAASLAERYLGEKDRVGLVSFGGVINWLPPRAGSCRSTASSTRCSTPRSCMSYAWKDIDLIPARDAAAEGARARALAAARRARRAGAARPARARLRPRDHRGLAACRSRRRGAPSSTGSRTGSGSCAARRCARATSGSACRWSSGARTCPCRLRSRR